ncbi:hypothetical protein T02_5832 [Trichinella nativa]|uniref:Uncharacterized protein n=1 Tax=Trichinella nativa TaxID=6335 RepID=A0A0V1KM55_9BILA|nr:hypothetical protein T02_12842 [Trichinella nativa]KRZ51329.1 hypothetical protein T02_5832 [Trichinella nativa]
MKIVPFSGFKISAEGINPADERIVKRIKTFRTWANTWDTPKTMLTRSNLMVNYAERSLAIRIRKKFPRCKDCLNN